MNKVIKPKSDILPDQWVDAAILGNVEQMSASLHCNGKHEGFCGGKILSNGICQAGAKRNLTVNVAFAVNGAVQQTIELFPDSGYSANDLPDLLKLGAVVTTIGSESGVYQVSPWKQIGRVTFQTALDETEFDFDYADQIEKWVRSIPI